ncbi:MAG TPA: hypothetical protein VG734_02730 [Lacunisphaera sp.]|nr:hypothetical protein [Lacunisphaera sp.]
MKSDPIFAAIISVFPKADQTRLSPRTKLGDLPGWDSMNSVNLQVELEGRLGVDTSGILFDGAMSVDELTKALEGCKSK